MTQVRTCRLQLLHIKNTHAQVEKKVEKYHFVSASISCIKRYTNKRSKGDKRKKNDIRAGQYKVNLSSTFQGYGVIGTSFLRR